MGREWVENGQIKGIESMKKLLPDVPQVAVFDTAFHQTIPEERQLREKAHIPTMTFDGDQSDPRVFSEAQYETRVEALTEIMEENRKKGVSAHA